MSQSVSESPLVWGLHQSQFLWNIFILFITFPGSSAPLWRPGLGWRMLPRPKNAASPKAQSSAPRPGQSTSAKMSPVAHFHRGRGPDLQPNPGQHWRVILSLETSTGSAEASAEMASLYSHLCPNLLPSFLSQVRIPTALPSNVLRANHRPRDCFPRSLTVIGTTGQLVSTTFSNVWRRGSGRCRLGAGLMALHLVSKFKK